MTTPAAEPADIGQCQSCLSETSWFDSAQVADLPLGRGTAKYGSKSDLYMGNGDEVVF